VANACNPSYLGGGDQEDHCLKPALGKKFMKPLSLPVAGHWGTLLSQLRRKRKYENCGPGWRRQKAKPYLKSNLG
jgi:hypothetical protein